MLLARGVLQATTAPTPLCSFFALQDPIVQQQVPLLPPSVLQGSIVLLLA